MPRTRLHTAKSCSPGLTQCRGSGRPTRGSPGGFTPSTGALPTMPVCAARSPKRFSEHGSGVVKVRRQVIEQAREFEQVHVPINVIDLAAGLRWIGIEANN